METFLRGRSGQGTLRTRIIPTTAASSCSERADDYGSRFAAGRLMPAVPDALCNFSMPIPSPLFTGANPPICWAEKFRVQPVEPNARNI
jgi:hypothetical protein